MCTEQERTSPSLAHLRGSSPPLPSLHTLSQGKGLSSPGHCDSSPTVPRIRPALLRFVTSCFSQQSKCSCCSAPTFSLAGTVLLPATLGAWAVCGVSWVTSPTVYGMSTMCCVWPRKLATRAGRRRRLAHPGRED